MKRSDEVWYNVRMKDWKTYAIVALALWCAWLTWKANRPQPLDPEAVWDAYETAKRLPVK